MYNKFFNLKKLRKRPGQFSAISLYSGLIALTYYSAPHLESDTSKYVVAGTTATVTVELLSHVIDTMNMKSKIID